MIPKSAVGVFKLIQGIGVSEHQETVLINFMAKMATRHNEEVIYNNMSRIYRNMQAFRGIGETGWKKTCDMPFTQERVEQGIPFLIFANGISLPADDGTWLVTDETKWLHPDFPEEIIADLYKEGRAFRDAANGGLK